MTRAPEGARRATTGNTPEVDATPRDAASAETSLRPGQRLGGKYVVKKMLGRGGTSDVFEAEHAAIGRHVAIKVFHGDMVTRDDMLARFSREARICGTVRHPNVGEVYDVGHLDCGLPFMVLELLDGQSLADLVAAGPMRIATVVEIARQLLDGLAAVHRIGVLHRDMKPDNVMLHHDGTNVPIVKLVDFGISKMMVPAANEPSITVEGFVVGTPFYMSPEQVRAGELDERADIYGVGVVLYECITGRLPFDGKTSGDVVAAILRDLVAPLRATRRDCPAELDAIVMKAIERKKDARFRDAREMQRALESVAADLGLAVGADAWQPEHGMTSAVRGDPRQRAAVLFALDAPSSADTVPQPLRVDEPAEVARNTLELASPSASIPARQLGSTGATRNQRLRLGLAAMIAAPLAVALGLWSPLAEHGAQSSVASVRAVDRAPAHSPPPEGWRASSAWRADPNSPDARPSPRPSPHSGRGGLVPNSEVSHAPAEAGGGETGSRRERSDAASSTSGSLSPNAARSQHDQRRQPVRAVMSNALAAYARGQLPLARGLYLRAVQMAPSNAGAWRGLGMVSRQMGLRTDATRAFRNYLRLAPNAHDAGRIRARLEP